MTKHEQEHGHEKKHEQPHASKEDQKRRLKDLLKLQSPQTAKVLREALIKHGHLGKEDA